MNEPKPQGKDKDSGKFLKGNTYWQFRNHDGSYYDYQPEEFWDKFVGYCKWIEANPLKEEKVFAYKGEIVKGEVNKMRAMTIKGFCLFADISRTTWDRYKEKTDYCEIVTRIEDAIYCQKLEGAAADLLNSNIIARDLGLTDKKSVEVTEQPLFGDDE